MSPNPNAKWYALAASLPVVALAVLAGIASTTTSDGLPANRMVASGSGLDVLSAPLTSGASSEVHDLLKGQVKLSSPTDLILRVTAECALWTDISVTGDADSESIASVKVWVEIDGVNVAVAPDDTGADRGKVVFCNRAFRMVTSGFDENQTIQTFLRTRSANGFNWIAEDADANGEDVHDVVVKAQLESKVTGVGEARAGIGKRTLIVEPVKLGTNLAA